MADHLLADFASPDVQATLGLAQAIPHTARK
jgi:hypothetical protein